jgi:adenine-specific DNA-methyltransferase
MSKNRPLQKLELTWIGKGEEPKLEPRILIENPEYSYGDPNSQNMLIHGDNLLALKALEQDYAGKVKCIYIDPPYNTGGAFEHYDDGVEHSLWLNLLSHRLKILYKLLSNDGIIWVTLDDNEAHYCKVMMDEIFGRHNFLSNVIWEKADSPRMDAKYFSSRHDHILVYTKKMDSCIVNRIIDTSEIPKHYNKKDEQGRIYYLKPLRAMGADGYREKRPSMYYGVIAPDGTEIFPKNPDGSDSRWRWGKEKLENDQEILEWIKTKNGWSLNFRIYWDNNSGTPPETLWHNDKVGTNRTSKKEIKDLFASEIFDTPKPEALIKRVIEITTNKGDLVLDSFLGSGTTAAVAHKMGRRWIGVELGEHAKTHCVPRMQKVIDGEQGGISKAVNWQGGGGFKFYTLAPSLLKKDKFGNEIINPSYNAEMLAAAMAKQEGFKYQPHESTYYKQGQSAEQDFIFTTTQFLTVEALDSIQDEMQPGETVLICCKSFQKECKGKYGNITIKKIPLMLLGRCEYGKEDYSLNIINMPSEAEFPELENEQDFVDDKMSVQELAEKSKKQKKNEQPGLFD